MIAPEPRRPLYAGSHTWLLGIIALLAIAFVVLGGARTEGPGARGLAPGAQLPAFAAPLATAGVDCDEDSDPCDANVATRAGQGSAGRRPACEVRGPTILNICELRARGPVVLAFLATRGGDCADTLDRLDRVMRRHLGVQAAAVGIRGEFAQLRETAGRHRWRFPVGWDRDGILAKLYGVAVCPHITFARWRGRVQSTILGGATEAELERRIAAVVAASRRAGWTPPAA
ncbi:MAG TPA: hypothetical protein VMY78_18585 [Solirubrobacteraceae bacterium]|nr:hypothetical protein [Solirubrobacteraceae bacterium]